MAEARSLQAEYSPCYLNRMEPLELAIGWGKAVEQVLRIALKKKGKEADDATLAALLADCLAPPLHGMVFPRDL